MVEVPGIDISLCPESGLAAATIMWAIEAEVVDNLFKLNKKPSILKSINFPGSAEYNETSYQNYAETGCYMLCMRFWPGAGNFRRHQSSHQRLDWKYFKPEEAPEQQLVTEALNKSDGTPAYCSEELQWHEESWVPADDREANPYDAAAELFYVNLYGAIANGEPLMVTPQEVRRQIEVVEQCFQQNKEFSSKHRAHV